MDYLVSQRQRPWHPGHGPQADRRSNRHSAGLTLIELLVVISILAVLTGLLLPSLQAAREAGRRTLCANNLKQMALAALAHEQQQGFFPSGGWGYRWVGDADRGFGRNQPGGWLYSCLPYLEQQAVWQLPIDGNPTEITAGQKTGANALARTLLPTVHCPTRRTTRRYPKPVSGLFIAYNANDNSMADNTVARADYAINAGDLKTISGHVQQVDWPGPPASAIAKDDPRSDTTLWIDLNPSEKTRHVEMTGLAYVGSEVRAAAVRDGLSNTYLMGERYIDASKRETGDSADDNETWVQGTNNDMVRTGWWQPCKDAKDSRPSSEFAFGSSHDQGFAMAFGDGSIRWLDYEIERSVHASLANRKDGKILPSSAY